VGHGQGAAAVLPDSSRPEVLVDLWLPEGSSFAANEEVARRVETVLRAQPGCKR